MKTIRPFQVPDAQASGLKDESPLKRAASVLQHAFIG
jgi:hypothetical protein